MAKKTDAEVRTLFDAIVVGASPAGLLRAARLAENGASVLILEAAETSGGSARSGFSLLDMNESNVYPILTGSMLDPLIVRWERQWVSPADVDWASKEWEATLPQWQSTAGRALSYFIDMVPLSYENVETRYRSPVVGIRREENLWVLSTPEREYQSPEVYWAAGITAFQNAVGKFESQKFLAANPKYQMAAADYRGGLGLDWELSAEEAAHFTVPAYQFFGLPVRFEGKYVLLMGALLPGSDGAQLRTFAHLHHERLKDPKILSAIQKALRRGLNSLFVEGHAPSNPKEKSYVHDRILGHLAGTPWVLESKAEGPGLVFIGEESLRAAESLSFDVSAALDSVL